MRIEEVNRDKTDEADKMNLEVDSKSGVMSSSLSDSLAPPEVVL